MDFVTPLPAAFADAVGELQQSSAEQRAALLERLAHTPLTTRAMIAMVDGRPVGTGTVVLEDALAGVYSMVTAPGMRTRGIATGILASLLALGVGTRRDARLSAGQRRQPSRGLLVPPVRLCRRVFVSLPRQARRMSLIDSEGDIAVLAAELGRRLAARGAFAATAESCTGGLVAGAITAIAGSSGWFDRGFVTYTNAAKTELLGVDAGALERNGAVSEATAIAMAEGALRASRADFSVAVTGIAGPAGGTPDKPVGTVCFAWAVRGGPAAAATHHFSGARDAVREASVIVALQGLIDKAGPAL